MKVLKKIMLGAVAPLTAAVLAAGVQWGSASAAPLTAFADTSVTAHQTGIDEIGTVSASYNGGPVLSASQVSPTTETSLNTTDFVQFSPDGGADTWSVAGSNVSGGLTFTLTPGGKLTATGTALASTGATVTAKVTDGTAAALDTLHVTPATGGVSLWTTPDTVTLNSPFNNNTAGEAVFTTVPAGVSAVLGNAPAGTSLTAGVLAASDSVPGTYHDVTVTAADSSGATAVQTDTVTVKGYKVHAAVPVLSHGHGVCIAPTRENVYFEQSGAPSWDHFTIVGPGAINGHEGWVNGHLGLNAGVYSGLEAHHGYAVYYTPVEGEGSSVPVPGSHGGYVYFVSDRNC